jgi:4-amino-4-deoxychorismate lyase
MTQTWINGLAADPTLSKDRGLQFGDGLFETIAVINGVPRLWERHFFRLQDGCERLGITCPDEAELKASINDLEINQDKAVLKLIVTAGSSSQGYARAGVASNVIFQVNEWPSAELYNDSNYAIKATVSSIQLAKQPMLAGMKHLNRLEQVLAKRLLPNEFDEAIVLDTDGNVVECISANIFIRLNDQWLTPKLDKAGIAGAMRTEVLAQATEAGVSVAETSITMEQLKQASAIWITNSLIGVHPVSAIDSLTFTSFELPSWMQRAQEIAL